MQIFHKLLIVCLIFFTSDGSTQAVGDGEILVDGKVVASLEQLEDAMVDGSFVYLGKGTYGRGLVIVKNNVTLSGDDAHFNEAILGKAAIIVKGDDTRIEGISCSGIAVKDKNGACIRQEGKNLTLINVHFYDSQQGILQNANTGFLRIKYSLFERLGKDGYAHAIYAQGNELLVSDTRVISTKSEGHAIKSRAATTKIINTELLSQGGDESRLVDIPNGGELIIHSSIFEQGLNTKNGDLIGFGLEGIHRKREHTIKITDSIFLLERPEGNLLINLFEKLELDKENVSNNLIIGNFKNSPKYQKNNYVFEDRQNAGIDSIGVPPISVLTAFQLGISK